MKAIAIVSGILSLFQFVMGFYMLFKGEMNLTKTRGIKGGSARFLGIVTLACAYGINFLLRNTSDVVIPLSLSLLPFVFLAIFSSSQERLEQPSKAKKDE